ncbi:hypothetical protein LSAT2_004448 [Lamellibrachia satsuma]|nr:hypothetical protein LSAT2_004448 [Lamellibrachia satsuma]
MMTEYLASRGLNFVETRVGRVLRETHRPYHDANVQGARSLITIPYFAECFGHKLHMDQNGKLAMFGFAHVLAIDGYSGKIVGSSSKPVKNNLLIYENVYR